METQHKAWKGGAIERFASKAVLYPLKMLAWKHDLFLFLFIDDYTLQ